MENERTKLLKARQRARLVGVRVRWLKNQADNGHIPCLKAEDIYLFNPDAVIPLLEKLAAKGGQR